MKRFTFFISVFSVGLVMFLAFTNQFGRLFDGGGEGEPRPAWIQEAQQASSATNRVRFRKVDHLTNLLVLELEGDLEDADGTGLDMNNLDEPIALRNAKILFPIYHPDASGTTEALTAMTQMVLRASKVQYDSASRLKLSDGITGDGDDGTHFETSELDVRYDRVTGQAHLHGPKPVRIAFPAVEIFGRGGFTGTLSTKKQTKDTPSAAAGLDELTIRPPVVVVLDRKQGGSLLGMMPTQSGSRNDNPPRSTDRQLFLVGDGPLTIDRVNNRAVFHDRVRIFEAPMTATIDSPPPPGDTWFSCEELQLVFDSQTLQFTGATALRGEQLVTFHLPGGNTITAGRLRWNEGSREALLDQGVHGSGALLAFDADTARLLSLERRCHLDGNVSAEFQRTTGSTRDTDPRLLSRWKMTGTDHAELSWLENARNLTERGRLQEFRATAAVAHGLQIAELRDDGAKLIGTTLVYDGATDTLRMLGTERAPGMRPTFTEGRVGRNHIEAGEIALALTRPQLAFKDRVEFLIHDLPRMKDGNKEDPKWLRERSDNDHARGTCHQLRLIWDEHSALQQVLATAAEGAGARPIAFELVGLQRAKLGGRSLTWVAKEQQIELKGAPGHLEYEGGAVTLSGEHIRFNIVDRTLDASDPRQVRLEALEASLLESTAAAGPSTPARPVVILSPNLHVQLAPPRGLDNSGSDSNREKSPLDTVLFARAWDDAGGFVEISDGVLVAMGQEVLWDATQHQLQLQGEGRQRILHLEGTNDDELTARSITVLTEKRQVILDGDVRGWIHQQPPATSNPSPTQSRLDVPWSIRSERLTATLSEVIVDGKTELALDDVEAKGRIRISSPDRSVAFEGSACHWARSRQTLVIADPDDDLALQTLRYGSPERGQSDVRAREIRITRNPGKKKNDIETLWVFLTGDVVGNFHTTATSSARPGQRDEPTSLRLLADNLLAELRPAAAARTDSQQQPLQLHTVSIWDSVNFLSGELCVLADRAVYTRPTETLVFSASRGKRVQLIEKNVTSKSFEELTLKQLNNGSYKVTARGADSFSGDEIEKILQLLQKPEKTPKKR